MRQHGLQEEAVQDEGVFLVGRILRDSLTARLTLIEQTKLATILCCDNGAV
jgi:hypothetical protein